MIEDKGIQQLNLAYFVKKKNGIVHDVISPYSFKSNGVTKRKNHALADMAIAILLNSNASKNLWR